MYVKQTYANGGQGTDREMTLAYVDVMDYSKTLEDQRGCGTKVSPKGPRPRHPEAQEWPVLKPCSIAWKASSP